MKLERAWLIPFAKTDCRNKNLSIISRTALGSLPNGTPLRRNFSTNPFSSECVIEMANAGCVTSTTGNSTPSLVKA